MFRVNLLDDLRHAIYESTVPASSAGPQRSWDTIAAIWTNAKSWLRKVGSSLGAVSGMISLAGVNLGTVGDLIARSAFLLVRDQIVYLDDLEWAGEGFKAGDVLGLISYLKEERNCSVALLLNDEAMVAGDRGDFQRLLEKVIDVSVTFSPTPA
jgi:hypothetical protein